MADDINVTEGSGKTVATDDVGGRQMQVIKVDLGGDGVSSPLVRGAQTSANSLPVVLASNQATVPVNQVSVGYDVAVTITRSANTTAYAANDVLGGALSVPVVGPSAGSVMITGLQLEADIAAIPSGQGTFRLALYNVTPPSALADNAAYDLPSGDRASFLGIIDIPALVDLGATLYAETGQINKQVRLSGTGLFGYLITNGAFTPAANSEVYKLTVHTVAL